MHVTVLRWIVLPVSVALWLISTAAVMPALAQQQNSNRGEFPGRRIGGGTRGECLIGNQPLVALNPANNLGVTASDRPSLYFAVPKFDEYPIEFVLRDVSGNSIYEAPLEADTNKDIVGVHLPKNTLKGGQDYQWYLSVVCDTEDRSQNIVLSGWLRRISSGIALEDASGLKANLKLVKSYQQAGLWNDAIATLVQLRQNYPNNDQVRLQWNQLLQQLELKSVFEPSVAGNL